MDRTCQPCVSPDPSLLSNRHLACFLRPSLCLALVEGGTPSSTRVAGLEKEGSAVILALRLRLVLLVKRDLDPSIVPSRARAAARADDAGKPKARFRPSSNLIEMLPPSIGQRARVYPRAARSGSASHAMGKRGTMDPNRSDSPSRRRKVAAVRCGAVRDGIDRRKLTRGVPARDDIDASGGGYGSSMTSMWASAPAAAAKGLAPRTAARAQAKEIRDRQGGGGQDGGRHHVSRLHGNAASSTEHGGVAAKAKARRDAVTLYLHNRSSV
ncbi:uncharacterized protein PSFLO_02739 [Pseudozyma flocculosa]|uniref:Uncharacterized protein n=1 Tax=Pseudozyma flocculosa TaxID=84751 RepID=A0A5C3F0P3_9BASI|nr:uncharacterized protein PSFLO_02739 [Pseudozyma flocculosa]